MANLTKQPNLPATRRRDWLRTDPFSALHDEIDEVFSHYFTPLIRDRKSAADFSMSTRLDMNETKSAVNVTVDVPGIEEKDIEISLHDNVLEISGHREEEAQEKDTDFHRIERSYGAFKRRVMLPCEVNAEKVKAKLANGVLKIRLPKSEKAKSNGRKIEITTS